jgi:hypothetical protein
VRGRRARPPPFAPRGAASPASPRGVASLSSTGGISHEMLPIALQIHVARMMLQGVQRCFRWIYQAHVGRGLAATPVHSTDVCCSQSSVFRDDSPSLDARLIAFPTRWGARGSRRPGPLRRSDRRPGVCSSPSASCRRASDASSPGGLPRRSCVHRRRPAIASATSGRTRRPRPSPPSRVNGLWLLYGPRHLPRPLASRTNPATRSRASLSSPTPFQSGT